MISVIVPMYNEERLIEKTLKSLIKQRGAFEVIVVDGGSTDQSVQVARAYAAVLSSQKGRGVQMNVGAHVAQGETLLFLHADTFLEEGALFEVEKAMQKRNVVGGCLTQAIEGRHLYYRWLEFSGQLRTRWFQVFYGDQAIFVRKEIFDTLRGYPSTPILEDVAFSQRLKRKGKTVILPKRVFCSPRRWEKEGKMRRSFRNTLLLSLYGLGMAPERLSRFYGDVR